MQKRKIIIGDYDTAANGWTLTKWKLSNAEQKTNYRDKPSGDGAWDLSTALTDGIPKYKDRELTATLECSENNRLGREAMIRNMVNLLDGFRWKIRLPDDDLHYVMGRVHVAREYNDLAHASVTVRAVCEPWKYAYSDTSLSVVVSSNRQVATLRNNARRAVVPTLTVYGTNASVLLEYGASSITLSEGAYQWPDLLLTPGDHELTYSGTGSLIVSFRKAVLE